MSPRRGEEGEGGEREQELIRASRGKKAEPHGHPPFLFDIVTYLEYILLRQGKQGERS